MTNTSSVSAALRQVVKVLGGGIALSLAACGGGQAEQAASSAASVQTASRDGSRVTINNGMEPSTLDPHKSGDMPAFAVQRQLFEGLVSNDPQGLPVPGLAERWETEDNKIWTFYLREAKWSNGDPITADDFVYSLRRLTDPATAGDYGSYLADAKVLNAAEINAGKAAADTLGVRALDAGTLQITLTEAVPYLPEMLMLPSTFPVHRKTVETYGDKWTLPENIVVSGAYQLKEWVVNGHILLARNRHYYNDSATRIGEVMLLPLDSTAAVSRFQAGEIDLTGVPPERFAELSKAYPDAVKTNPRLCTSYMEFNGRRQPFDNVNVRRAVSMALNREVMAEKVLGRGETAAYQFLPPAINGYVQAWPEWARWDMAKRGAAASELLAQAGFTAEKPLEIELLYSTSEAGKRLVSAASSLWQEAVPAIRIRPVNQEWKTFLDTRKAGKFGLSFWSWCADYNEPSTFLNVFRSNNANNASGFSSRDYDALLDRSLEAGLTPAQRGEVYREAEKMVGEAYPAVFVYNMVASSLVNPKLRGYSPEDATASWLVKNWSFEGAR
ncbi:peptide ABC transporter substrate-binding protein [Neisseria leonii]|uniref:peptide ABC transporter substrate-binding protein n=1 Tax=Neisseria leonii TaxID=2995413 RepID=UPI00237B883D|nr:peptide ABC transporter substrate-binding protein [Neisseria sp. 3986]MDD9325076.1 peptide ABC transporter substrate-binding protein [Neisseria sp. 3986]